jgi:hypothetical protein
MSQTPSGARTKIEVRNRGQETTNSGSWTTTKESDPMARTQSPADVQEGQPITTQTNFSDLTPEQAAQMLEQRKAEIAALRKITKGTPADKSASSGGVNRVLSTANANARANDVLTRAQARVDQTRTDHDAAVAAYLQRYNLTEMPEDLVNRVEASRQQAVANLTTAREKISAKLKGRTTSSETEPATEQGTEPAEAEAAD